MILLLDSDAIIDWLAGSLLDRLGSDMSSATIGISTISAAEVLEGFQPNDSIGLGRWEAFLHFAEMYAFDLETASVAADIRRTLRGRRAQITHRAVDILIAATAIQHELELVTRNTRHFEDIEGLRLWRPNESSYDDASR